VLLGDSKVGKKLKPEDATNQKSEGEKLGDNVLVSVANPNT
jgi:hypothetical protein